MPERRAKPSGKGSFIALEPSAISQIPNKSLPRVASTKGLFYLKKATQSSQHTEDGGIQAFQKSTIKHLESDSKIGWRAS